MDPELLRIATAVYRDWLPDPETVRLYGRLLADLPREALAAGLDEHIKESPFPPLVADWRRRALAHCPPGMAEETPLEDYRKATREVLRRKYEAAEAKRRGGSTPPLAESRGGAA